MQEKKVFKRNPDMVTRIIGDETILMPIFKNSEEINSIYTLGGASADVWNLIDGKKTLGRIKEDVLKKHDATEKEVETEMESFFKELEEIKAIKVVKKG